MVVREYPQLISLQKARDDQAWLDDEGGEFLYGGSMVPETLTSVVEILHPKKGWIRV